MKNRTLDKDLYEFLAVVCDDVDNLEKDCDMFESSELPEIIRGEELDYPRVIYPKDLNLGLVFDEEAYCLAHVDGVLHVAYSNPESGSISLPYDSNMSVFDQVAGLMLRNAVEEFFNNAVIQ